MTEKTCRSLQRGYLLLEAMRGAGVDRMVFSSTAAVYGEPEAVPITEDSRLAPTNVYGRTKLAIEGMLADYDHAYDMRYVALRYFNAAGASRRGPQPGKPSYSADSENSAGRAQAGFYLRYRLSDG